MSRKPNRVETVPIRVSTTPQARALLERAVATGLYGKNVAEAAERLITRSLEDLVRSGFLERVAPVNTPTPAHAGNRPRTSADGNNG